MKKTNIEFIVPDWPAPANVCSFITTRTGGVSEGDYNSFNLAAHVGDNPNKVEHNRQSLYKEIGGSVTWLNQTHSTRVVVLGGDSSKPINGDATFSSKQGVVCSVMTADCLPLLICDSAGTQVAAIHAGWKGLADGIVSESLKYFTAKPSELIVYLGPAISQPSFEVGEEVIQAFATAEASRPYREPIRESFLPLGERYLADLYRLARSELNGYGVTQIYGGTYCTYKQEETFFSYRRDTITGRMASLIWLQNGFKQE